MCSLHLGSLSEDAGAVSWQGPLQLPSPRVHTGRGLGASMSVLVCSGHAVASAVTLSTLPSLLRASVFAVQGGGSRRWLPCLHWKQHGLSGGGVGTPAAARVSLGEASSDVLGCRLLSSCASSALAVLCRPLSSLPASICPGSFGWSARQAAFSVLQGVLQGVLHALGRAMTVPIRLTSHTHTHTHRLTRVHTCTNMHTGARWCSLSLHHSLSLALAR